MRFLATAAVGLGIGLGVVPAMAQNLGDVTRQLKDQFLPGQNQSQDRDRNAYEQGRRDQEDQARRQRESSRDRDDRSRGYDDRNDRNVNRADRNRRNSDGDYNRNFDRNGSPDQYDDPLPRSR